MFDALRRKLTGTNRGEPIVVVSGMAGRHLAVPAPNASFEKPVDREEYLKTIKSLLE